MFGFLFYHKRRCKELENKVYKLFSEMHYFKQQNVKLQGQIDSNYYKKEFDRVQADNERYLQFPDQIKKLKHQLQVSERRSRDHESIKKKLALAEQYIEDVQEKLKYFREVELENEKNKGSLQTFYYVFDGMMNAQIQSAPQMIVPQIGADAPQFPSPPKRL